ncbi:MAG: 50S ribosomal protein L13 [Syntrophothermus sp.]|uniref:50S ribosomal protein L13 n=1 Tax=Syntrophothermus sp. TaxID=2736299 RepID=UPI0025798A3F|nr:50S ribosomal protein L13 [Syntrophothermus sp.]NSW82660.1 50S ribosomal protein L13 [Syntrophothermus sp.]
MAKPSDVERKWYVLDADGQTLGRLAAQAAYLLRGKHKPTYTPHIDTGDFVIVVNADKVRLTGNKLLKKKYIHHTRYPGGLREMTYRDLLDKNPEKAVEIAIKGMLPHNRLGKKMFKKLKVYRGPDHPHQAQKPEAWILRG